MRVDDFSYELPAELISAYPLENRSASRLLCLDSSTGEISHNRFADLVSYLQPKDLLVFNDTKVIPARFFGEKETGGKIEILVERLLQNNRLKVQIKASKSPKLNSKIVFYAKNTEKKIDSLMASIVERDGGFFTIQFKPDICIESDLFPQGSIPLPPYMKRKEEHFDESRYQTVYAKKSGAVAAPTAGLHFDDMLINNIHEKGFSTTFITLHVGAGTFQPVRVEKIKDHKMHKELFEVSAAVSEQVNACKKQGGRVIAIGTTSVRSLEAAAVNGEVRPFFGETDIFIYPGYQFQIVDAMITNFHLSGSTLLMLVSAFSSKKMILDAYSEAIAKRYRFFSYGDAMLIY
tara:strand:- start:3362 stop:4405 length:1044 start_codon:yes stop_codon:yes gene_type:complete